MNFKLRKILILLTIPLLLLPLCSSHAEVELVVDFQKTNGKIKHNALGFLHPLGKTGEPNSAYPQKYDDEYFKPLAPIWFRGTSDALSLLYPRAIKYSPNARFVIALSDSFPRKKNLPWENNFKEWDEAVTRSIEKAKRYSVVPVYDFFNEPENYIDEIHKKNPKVSEDELWTKLFELYVRTYGLVKKFHPEAKITGPGFGYTDFTPLAFDKRFTEYKDVCVKNNCLPSYWNFHFPQDQLEEITQMFKSWNLPQVGFLLCEYLGPSTYKLPAANLETFAYYENFPELDGSMRATWIRWGEKFATLGGTIGMDTPDHQPNSKYYRFGTWYCYKAYAEMRGNLYKTETPKPLRVLAGNLDEGYRLLIGSQNYSEIKDRSKKQGPCSVEFTGEVTLHLFGLPNGNYTVTLQEIPQPGSQKTKDFKYTAVNSLPAPLVENKTGSELDVQFNWKNANSGWYLDIIPQN